MKILDNFNKELTLEEIDETKGRLVPDKILVKHHEETPEIQEQGYMFPTRFYFLNGETYDTVNKDDEHVDPQGNFIDIDNKFDMESNEVVLKNYRYIITQPFCGAIPAWNEYEQIQRYIPYSEEELKEIEERKQDRLKQEQEEAQRQDLLVALPSLLEEKDKKIQEYADIIKQQQEDINDIILTLSEFIGVGDEDVLVEDVVEEDAIENPVETPVEEGKDEGFVSTPIEDDSVKDIQDASANENAFKDVQDTTVDEVEEKPIEEPVTEDVQTTTPSEENNVAKETVEDAEGLKEPGDEDSAVEEPITEGTGKKE